MKKSKIKKSNSPYLKILLAILIIGAISYYTISRQPKLTPQPIGINEIAPSAATVTLSLPVSIKGTAGVESSTDIMIDAGSSTIAAAQVELTYDQSKLATPTLVQGDFLTDKLGNPKIDGGKISFIYTAPLGSGGKSGSGKLATLKFKPISGDSQIKFTSNTVIAAIGLDTNALSSATGTTIQTTSSASPVAPPVLADIVPIPTLAPSTTTPNNIPTKTTTPKPPVNTPSNTQPTTPTNLDSRTFNDAGNFDYSNTSNVNIIESETESIETRPSGIARFIAWIKSIFGGNSAEN